MSPLCRVNGSVTGFSLSTSLCPCVITSVFYTHTFMLLSALCELSNWQRRWITHTHTNESCMGCNFVGYCSNDCPLGLLHLVLPLLFSDVLEEGAVFVCMMTGLVWGGCCYDWEDEDQLTSCLKLEAAHSCEASEQTRLCMCLKHG